MSFQIKKATKTQAKLRMAVFGPSGAGKTMTALRIAAGLGGKIGVIDTERGSAAKYSDRWPFDVIELESHAIDQYTGAIKAFANAGYDVLIVDSLSHAWEWLLEFVDKLGASKYKGNKWSAWSEATPKQQALVDAMLSYPGHIIATMRSKTEWVTEVNDRGRSAPVRVGVAPKQREGVEYEFDVLLEMNVENIGRFIKDRTGRFQDEIITKPDEELGRKLAAWLSDGEPVPEDETPRLSPEKAASLADRLDAVLDMAALEFASEITGRPISEFTDLTTGEALRVFNAAPKPESKPAAAPSRIGAPIREDEALPAEELEVESETAGLFQDEMITGPQLKALHTRVSKLGFTGSNEDKDRAREFIGHLVGRELASSKDLTKNEAHAILDATDDDLALKLDSFNAEREMAAEETAA